MKTNDRLRATLCHGHFHVDVPLNTIMKIHVQSDRKEGKTFSSETDAELCMWRQGQGNTHADHEAGTDFSQFPLSGWFCYSSSLLTESLYGFMIGPVQF